MANPRTLVLYTFKLLMLLQAKALCNQQHKVGDLSAWGVPSNPRVYTKWSKTHIFKTGDSLFFLYPPSQDSVIQVTAEAYKSCNLKEPILKMNNGNSLFNLTCAGEFYFTSGELSHCLKGQKLYISSLGNGSSVADSPSYGPSTSLPDTAAVPSYPNVFGSIPTTSSSSSMMIDLSVSLVVFIWALFF